MASEKNSDEQIKKMSMIEIAAFVLGNQKKEMNFPALFQQTAELKGYSESEKQEMLATFYTDLNVDGRFMALGSNVWGLRRWYPVKQTTEKSLAASRKRDLEEAHEEAEIENEEKEEADALEGDYEYANMDDDEA